MKSWEEKIYRAAILQNKGIGSQRLRQMLAFFGSAENAWKASLSECSQWHGVTWFLNFLKGKENIDPEKIGKQLKKEHISLVMPGEESYPCLLAECSDAPPLLFHKGFLQPSREGIAIVGSRVATPYGKAAAALLAKEIVQDDYVIVSGLARGIDSAAHQGALEGDGTTWAFLAGGLDTLYPPENARLACAIMEKGALLSEYPPGMPAEAGHFPARNRLISGSSRGVVVVEAAEKSGSLITVDFALEQGREVFAVPGPIFSELSKGTHQLIKNGAKLAVCKEDILHELPPLQNGLTRSVTGGRTKEIDLSVINSTRMKMEKNKEWEEILSCLSDLPLHIDRITALCPLSAQEIALGLLELQLAGEIIQLPGQHYVLHR